MPWEMLCQCYGASLKLATVQTPQGLHFTREYKQSHVPSVHSSWLPPWASIHSACGELYSTWRIYAFCLPCWALLGRSLSVLCLSFSSCEQGWALQLWVAQSAEIISEFSSRAVFHSSLPSTENWSNLGWMQIVAPCIWTPPISCCSPVGTVWILIFISPSGVKESRKDINMLWKLTKKKKLPAKFLVEKPWLVQIQQNPESP